MRVSRSDYVPEVAVMQAEAKVAEEQDSAASTDHRSESFGQMLRAVGHELDQGEARASFAIASIAHGKDMSFAQLITLQTDVYRYSEVIDIASRFVDRATSSVKTVLQGGGQ